MKRLRELREDRKLSQKEIANHLGISRQAYNRYELGQRSPDNTMLIELATFFDVSVDYLLEKTEVKKTISQYIKDANTNYNHNQCNDHNNKKLQEKYLKLAFELQEFKIDPEDIRDFIKILLKNNE